MGDQESYHGCRGPSTCELTVAVVDSVTYSVSSHCMKRILTVTPVVIDSLEYGGQPCRIVVPDPWPYRLHDRELNGYDVSVLVLRHQRQYLDVLVHPMAIA